MNGTAALAPDTFRTLANLLKGRSGLVIGPDKAYLLESRLAPLMKQEGLHTLDALAARLLAPGSEHLARAVVEAMTTNETSFFRDTLPFSHLRDTVLPRLHRARPPGARLRIWSAAASGGQEAWSLAIMVAECPDVLGRRDVDVIGTDLSRAQVAHARAGRYTPFEVARGLTPALLDRYFLPCGDGWRVRENLRRRVAFRGWNLLDDPRPLGRFDVVFLRNVLIYFDAPTKARVLERITSVMTEDGVLCLGAAETVLGSSDRLVTEEVAGVFRKDR